VRETAKLTGLSEKTIWEDIRVATELSEDVKKMIRGTELEDRKMDLLEQDKDKSGNCNQDK
jgi:hypothetical protein